MTMSGQCQEVLRSRKDKDTHLTTGANAVVGKDQDKDTRKNKDTHLTTGANAVVESQRLAASVAYDISVEPSVRQWCAFRSS